MPKKRFSNSKKQKNNKMTKEKKKKAKYKKYSDEQLERAIQAQEEGLSFRKAAIENGVPKSTVYRQILRSKFPKTIDKRRILSLEQEEKVLEQMVSVTERGIIVDNKLVKEMATLVLGGKIPEGMKMTDSWLHAFMKRNGYSWKKGSMYSLQRWVAVRDVDRMSNFYDLYECLLEKFLFDPSRIFNVDEKPILLQESNSLTWSPIGQTVAIKLGNQRAHVTLVNATSADGAYYGPFFIIKGQRKGPALQKLDTVLKGTGGFSLNKDSAFMTSETFLDYIKFLVSKIDPSKFPILLIIDGHSSHMSVAFAEYAEKNNIIVLVLPSHTSSHLQPLDSTVHQTIANKWREQTSKLTGSSLPLDLMGKIVLGIVSELSQRTVRAGFEKSGIWPLERKTFFSPEYTKDFESKMHSIGIPLPKLNPSLPTLLQKMEEDKSSLKQKKKKIHNSRQQPSFGFAHSRQKNATRGSQVRGEAE